MTMLNYARSVYLLDLLETERSVLPENSFFSFLRHIFVLLTHSSNRHEPELKM